ncbi:MAG: phosphomannomutase/phosphoglucomutase, partial [Hasllibacter sp.]
SHMKRRLAALGPGAAAFERSGHVFLAPPGYDDGPRAAAALLRLVAREGPLRDLADALPATWATPPFEPPCPDAAKRAVAARLADRLRGMERLGGTPVAAHVEAGGLRAVLADGSWALIRHSSNTPNLVVMAESTRGAAHRDAILSDLRALLATEPGVGPLR